VNTAFFAWTRNLEIYRFTQLLLILILPWLLTVALGGFQQSSVVIIWAALCPLGSLLLEEPRRTLIWVAGVNGRRKFIYDLWGETVNMASRMESHGASGVIQITRNTFTPISDEFDCEARGTIDVKGAGRVETWCVTGTKPND
jgi:hypothetical protein